MGRTRRGRLQTRQRHATPPPPSAFRSGAPSATGAPRARFTEAIPAGYSAPDRPRARPRCVLPARLACLSPARARRDMRAPRPRLAFSMCRVKAQGGRCRVAEPSARPVAVARFSLDTVMIALPSGSSCSCLCGQLNNSGSRSLRVPNPDPTPSPASIIRALVGWWRRQAEGAPDARAGRRRPASVLDTNTPLDRAPAARAAGWRCRPARRWRSRETRGLD